MTQTDAPSNQSTGLRAAIRKDLPAIAIFLLAGALLAIGIRAAVTGDGGGPSRDRQAMPHEGHESPESNRHQASKPAAALDLVIDLGNEVCPIMKKPVSGRSWTVWNGIRVGHCCQPCSADLLKDPERLLDEAGIEWREAAADVRRYREASAGAKPGVRTEIASKFTVISATR